MAIIIETYQDDKFIRTYSDEGYYIERDGVLYIEAIDPYGSEREYSETSEKIPMPPADFVMAQEE